jgi:hypothetical protein
VQRIISANMDAQAEWCTVAAGLTPSQRKPLLSSPFRDVSLYLWAHNYGTLAQAHLSWMLSVFPALHLAVHLTQVDPLLLVHHFARARLQSVRPLSAF